MKTLDDLHSGIYLLENLRFHDEETNYSNIEIKDGNEDSRYI